MRAIPPEKREEVEKLERKHAENPEGRYFVPLANALRKAGDVRGAQDLLREGLQKHPDYVSAHIVLGRCHQDEGDLREAESRFRQVLTLDPQNLVALRAMGDIAVGNARLDDARKWFGLLLEVDPMNEEARIALHELPPAGVPDDSTAAAVGGAEANGNAEILAWDERGEVTPEEVESAAETGSEDQTSADETPVLQSGGAEGGDGTAIADGGFTSAAAAASEPSYEEDEVAAEPAESPTSEHYPPGDDRSVDYDRFSELEEDGFEGEGAVITETIAELYVRQGFYDRAVSVYQELIRRRGPDTGLEDRLARARRLAVGEPADELPGEESPIAEPASATAEGDPFADSFADGFPSTSTEPTPAAAAESEAWGREAGVERGDSGAESEEETRGIGSYLRAVLAWTPAVRPTSGDMPSSASDEAAGSGLTREDAAGHVHSPSDTEEAPAEHDFVEGYTWARQSDVPALADHSHASAAQPRDDLGERPREDLEEGADGLPWIEPTVEPRAAPEDEPLDLSASPDVGAAEATEGTRDRERTTDFDPEPVAPPPTSSADDDLFPWELPVERAAPQSRNVEPDTSDVEGVAGDATVEPGSSLEESRAQEDLLIEPSAPFEPSETPPPSSEAERPRASDEEDDDLESFQAWLRSLKR